MSDRKLTNAENMAESLNDNDVRRKEVLKNQKYKGIAMSVKLEIIADNMDELENKLIDTHETLFSNTEFCEEIDNKMITSSFFTEYATITKQVN
jgi:hypothetical protein